MGRRKDITSQNQLKRDIYNIENAINKHRALVELEFLGHHLRLYLKRKYDLDVCIKVEVKEDK